MTNSRKIKEAFLAAGASLVGITSAESIDGFCEYIARRSRDFGDMTWLARSSEKRSDPGQHLKDAKSVIVTAWNYGSERDSEFFARYSLKKDYHEVIQKKMREVWNGNGIFFVDSKPLAEKPLAMRAGLGWIGKNTLLINKNFGSYFCLGLIITDQELEVDQPCETNCGDCRKCIDACPTGALDEAGNINQSKCISYLTTEHKGEIPKDLKPLIGTTLFGCDLCQEACPYNKKPSDTPGVSSGLEELASLTEEGFNKLFDGTPVLRLGFKRFKRNISIALDNING